MKKSYLILSSLLLAGAGLSANAQQVFLSGEMNGWSGWDNDPWELTEDADVPGMYRGTFEIPAGKLVFNFEESSGVLVPGTFFDPSGENVEIVWDGDFYQADLAIDANFAYGENMWYDNNWEGGWIEFTVDLSSDYGYYFNMSMVDEPGDEGGNTPGEPAVEYDMYISGSFNDYTPDGLEVYGLAFDEETFLYKGTFYVDQADEVTFNLVMYGMINIIPAGEEDPEDQGYYLPSEENVVVLDGDTYYEGLSTTGPNNVYWQINNWEGGNLEVTLDPNDMMIYISSGVAQEPVTVGLYIAGAWNDFNPEMDESWQINPFDVSEGYEIYRGTFDVPANQLQFNIVTNYGQTLVPAQIVDGEVEPLDESVAVFGTDPESYEGNFANNQNPMSNAYYWEDLAWTGGKLEVTVDYINHTIQLSAVRESEPEPVFAQVWIQGSFNEGAVETETWELGLIDETTESYRGTFDIPAGEFSVNFVTNYGMTVVPGVIAEGGAEAEPANANAELTFVDDQATGVIASTRLADETGYYWTVENWEGGNVQITIDFYNQSILFDSQVEMEEPTDVGVYLIGSFNEEVGPQAGVWQLNLTDAPEVYRGTFDIPAGEFKVNFATMYGKTYGPATVVDEEIEGLDEDQYLTFEDDQAFSNFVVVFNPEYTYSWVVENWEGGFVEITVDFNDNSIIFDTAVNQEPEEGGVVYVRGNFNDWDPAGLEIWSLRPVEGDPYTYSGTFTIGTEVSELVFNFDYETMTLVPATENAEGDVEPATENEEVTLEDGFATSAFTSTGFSNVAWVINGWTGGSIKLTVDFMHEMVIFDTNDEEEFEPHNLFIVGNFNDWDPAGLEIWSVNYNADDSVYEGEIEIKTNGEISFYFDYDGITLVPGMLNAEDDFEATDAPVYIFTDGNTFEGYAASTGLANNTVTVWTCDNWVDGEILHVVFDPETYQVTFKNDGTVGINGLNAAKYLNGAIYNLQGVKVDANKLTKGIYIIDGKKVVVK